VTRFVMNRRWTFILALGACLVCCSMSSTGSATAAIPNGTVVGDPGDPSNQPPAGDPDLPTGPNAKRGACTVTQSNATLERRTAGDGMAPRGVWMMRIRILLQGWRAFVRF